MRNATLCFLIKEDSILLAMKKKGFGVGRWNGAGGKVEAQESIEDAVKREVKEEIGVLVKDIKKVSILNFYFPFRKEWDQSVHVYIALSWDGEPEESDEMMPKWFNLKDIPYNKMWDDDKYWLPKVLEGKNIIADFTFKQGDIVEEYNIKEAEVI